MGRGERWILGVLFCFCFRAAAQSGEFVYDLDTITVRPIDSFDAIGEAMDPLELPLSLSSIRVKLNEIQGSFTLRDALSNSAGVMTGSGNGVHDFFVIRGVDSLSGGLVLVDGVPEPEATFYPMHHVQSVQVLKGPGSVYFGANSLVGAVNLVRKPPRFDHFAGLRLGIGSHQSIRVEADSGTFIESPEAAIRINALFHSSESHRDQVDAELTSINPSILWHVSSQATVRLDVDYQYSEATPDAGVPVVGNHLLSSSRSLTFQEPLDRSQQDVWRVLLRYDHTFSPGHRLQNRAYYSRLDWESIGTVYAGFVRFDLGFESEPITLSRIRPHLDDRQQILGDEAELSLDVVSGDFNHRLVLGAEYARYTDVFTLELPPAADINTRSRSLTPGLLPPQAANTGDATSDIYSLYVMDHMNSGRAWSLHVGSRLDWLEFQDGIRDTSRSDVEYSPFVGVVYRPRPVVAFFVNAGLGFAPPSALVQGPRTGPENSRQLEGGFKLFDPDRRYSAQISWYELERDQIAIPNSSGLFSENGKQDSRGAEMEVEARWADRVAFRLAYGYLNSQLDTFREQGISGVMDRSGNTAPFAPRHTVSLWSDLKMTAQWSIGAGVRGVSDHFIAPDNQFEIDGYVVADAVILHQQARWNAALHINNLTGENYATRGQGGVSVIPGDGVSVMGYVGVKL